MSSSASNNVRRLIVLAVLVLAVSLAGSAVAQAGTYDVVACDAAGGANNSWVPQLTGAPFVTTSSDCPSAGDASRGMTARNSVQANSVAGPLSAQLRFTAPAGTSIVSIQASDDFYSADPAWEAALSTGSQILRGCGAGGTPCRISHTNETIPVDHAPYVYIDAFCPGGSCPLNSNNADHAYVEAAARLYSATVRLEDDVQPTLGTPAGALWTDGWKRGTLPVSFDASDNTGIRQTALVIDGQTVLSRLHDCDASRTVPCPQGGDSFDVPTASLGDGTHQVGLLVTDSAGNQTSSERTVAVDNTPPAPPESLTVYGGDGWHSSNDLTARWTNPTVQGAPIAAAVWTICRTSGGDCISGSTSQQDISHLDHLRVPSDGDWTLTVRLTDQAGNTLDQGATARLRVDTQAPDATFAPQTAADPDRLTVSAADATSGLASGSIELKPHDTQGWTAIPAEVAGNSLSAVVPDETLPDGVYDLRAHVADQAGNERTTTSTTSGQPATLTLPLRVPTRLSATFRRGRNLHTLIVARDRRQRITGRLVDPAGNPLRSTSISVSQRLDLPGTQLAPLRTVRTSRTGQISFQTTRATASRVLVIRYEGTATIRPSQIEMRLRVRASSTIHASHHAVQRGKSTIFTGGLRGGAVPATGLPIQLQVLVNGHWQTFASPRTDARGRWHYRYRFTGHYARAAFRFRALIPRDPAYPFTTGRSASTTVRVHP